ERPFALGPVILGPDGVVFRCGALDGGGKSQLINLHAVDRQVLDLFQLIIEVVLLKAIAFGDVLLVAERDGLHGSLFHGGRLIGDNDSSDQETGDNGETHRNPSSSSFDSSFRARRTTPSAKR